MSGFLMYAADVFKVPLGIAGGVLVAWAALISGIGLSRPEFPGGVVGQRAVMGATLLLVVVVMGIAVQLG
ncbi:MAG: hypothetical protein JO321_12545 [Solirubrobacterales bacterium]|nr:hypothetical protein [Solirubrobacterales bacterium]MBV8941663.1 hypothetical protein [Solirubrobacterales bacterium]MBV9165595.1 hypothetical protein [Solirubrobacterales bacterium]MBV9536232.1 hypothetical protein [Solirubrobacterales bacterium]